MAYEDKEFLLDRETLQLLAGPAVSRDEEALVILAKLKGKEISATLRDENFAMVNVKGTLIDKASGASKVWIEDWKGFRLPKPWGLKVKELSY